MLTDVFLLLGNSYVSQNNEERESVLECVITDQKRFPERKPGSGSKAVEKRPVAVSKNTC